MPPIYILRKSEKTKSHQTVKLPNLSSRKLLPPYASNNASSKNSSEKNLPSSFLTHVINVTGFFKVMSSGNLSYISIKILVLSMPIIYLILSNALCSI